MQTAEEPGRALANLGRWREGRKDGPRRGTIAWMLEGETVVCKVLNGAVQCAGDWEEVCGRNSVSGARLLGIEPLALLVTVGVM